MTPVRITMQMFYRFFPLGQNCSGLRTCALCLEHPECGWCGDPSSTGKGVCMEGSYRGPMKRPAKQGLPVQAHLLPQDMSLELGSCPREKGFEWAFIQCPGKGITSFLSYWNYRSLVPVCCLERMVLLSELPTVLSWRRCSYQRFQLQLLCNQFPLWTEGLYAI